MLVVARGRNGLTARRDIELDPLSDDYSREAPKWRLFAAVWQDQRRLRRMPPAPELPLSIATDHSPSDERPISSSTCGCHKFLLGAKPNPYSSLSATIGSTCVARTAGTRLAAAAGRRVAILRLEDCRLRLVFEACGPGSSPATGHEESVGYPRGDGEVAGEGENGTGTVEATAVVNVASVGRQSAC